jgi:hypothetical protein
MKIQERYSVIILQATGEPLEIKESSNFAECKVIYEKIVADLEIARKTKKLFRLSDPWIFSCDPQFIVRVTLVPKKVPVVADSENPYQRRMLQKGFAAAMKNPPEQILGGGELTDEGYKE